MGHKYNISKKNKLKIWLWGGVYALVLLVVLTLVLEGLGTFVGYILDKPTAENYIKTNYPGVTYEYKCATVINTKKTVLGIPKDYKSYRFTFEAVNVPDGKCGTLEKGDEFYVDAYNFNVTSDSILMEYTIDNAVKDEINETFLSELKAYCDVTEEISFEVKEAYVDTKIKVGEAETARDAFKLDVVKDADVVVHVLGERLSYEDYKTEISKIVSFYDFDASEIPEPKNFQVFYYYEGEDGNSVPQYESQFTREQLGKTPDELAKAEGTHYRIELEEKEESKVKLYNFVKSTYIIFLSATILVLYTLLTYRKIKKCVKQGNEL